MSVSFFNIFAVSSKLPILLTGLIAPAYIILNFPESKSSSSIVLFLDLLIKSSKFIPLLI
ncbi:hypothetical protein Q5M85_12035 [Paraclostridium bifermentans]|nr:hypothetical protein [Paraclostridium bifermentans]